MPTRSAVDESRLKLRSAIQRFATGNTSRTDGSWTIVNLVKESGVSRPTLYRQLYDVERRLFEELADAVPSSAASPKEQIRELKRELAAERTKAAAERKRHHEVEDIMLNRIHALSLLVASALGKDGVPALFPEFVRRRSKDDQG